MRIILAVVLCLLMLPLQTDALEIEAPEVPEAGRDWMPGNTESLWQGIGELTRKAADTLRPDLQEASRVSLGILAAVLLTSVLRSFSSVSARAADMAGAVAIGAMLLFSTESMVHLAAGTVQETGTYGKLLLGVMTGALAAQGGITSSAALYGGTTLFTALLQSAMTGLLIPGIYLYLALQVGNAVTGEDLLKRMGDLLKGLLSWCLRLLLLIFTTYLSLTHVVSGTTDAAALKAAKVSMSSFVPVVGGILSDASEAVLVSVGMMKNAAGIYGILAVLALCLHPFLQIGLHYLILKLTAGICGIFGSSKIMGIIDCFSIAMGLLLGMTGSSCVMVLISTVCFMRGGM